MKVGRKVQYAGVLDIPEQRICIEDGHSWEIRHVVTAAGEALPLANARTMFFGNPERGSVTFPEPVRWHHLLEDGGKWMTDYPIEQAQHDRELRRMRRGSVLVGGLGLGYAALLLALRPGIRQVVVVEKEAAVIHLVKDALLKRLGPCASKVSVVHADLFDFLRARTLKTRWAFYDIWTSDGEGTLVETVLPLLDLSRGLVQHQPVCWNEGVMRGQLALALSTRLQMLAAGHSWVPEGQTPLTMDDLCREPVPDDHYRAFQLMRAHFFRWARRHKRLARQGVYCSAYAGLYGQWDWQEKWDAYWRSRAYSDRRPARLSKRG